MDKPEFPHPPLVAVALLLLIRSQPTLLERDAMSCLLVALAAIAASAEIGCFGAKLLWWFLARRRG